MTDEKQPKQQRRRAAGEQADLELDEEQTDEVKGGGNQVRAPGAAPDKESGRYRG